MTCKIPGLGTVTGYKTLKEIVDGSAAASDDAPAVTYRDLGGDAPEATANSSGDGKALGDDASASGDEGDSGEGSASSSDEDDSDEDKAEELFKLARTYIMSGHGKMGKDKLRELIRLYPKTRSAQRAKRLLGS